MVRRLLSLALVLAALTTLSIAAQRPARVVAFVGVNVVPMDGQRVLEAHTVIVRDGTIAGLAPSTAVAVPAGATTVDGRGRWLIPGLAEMHAHIPGGAADEAAMLRVLELFVLNGVTLARGMLGDPRHLALRERARTGEILSPVIYTSGPSFNGTSVTSVDVAVEMVRQQKAAGFDFLKIHPGVPRDAFEALARTAAEQGIRFAGHVPLAVGLERALELKFETIDHLDGYVEAMVKPDAPVKAADSQWFGVNLAAHLDESRIPALVAATKAAGVWNVPTQSLFESTVGPLRPEQMAAWPEMRWVSQAAVEQWSEWKRRAEAAGTSTPQTRARFLAVRRALIKALHDGGTGLLLGADAPQMWNVPGFAIHRELEALVNAGLTPWQAIATGTRNVAACYGALDRSGTIEAGRRADLVLLAADPLADIRNTRRIEGVMIGGRWLPKAEIDQRLAALALRP